MSSSTTCTRRKWRPQLAEGSGYNPVVTGADALLSDAAKKNFEEAYPGDSLEEPLAPAARAVVVRRPELEYADKFKVGLSQSASA